MTKWKKMNLTVSARRAIFTGWRDGGDRDRVANPQLFELACDRVARLLVMHSSAIARGGSQPTKADRFARIKDAQNFALGTVLLGA